MKRLALLGLLALVALALLQLRTGPAGAVDSAGQRDAETRAGVAPRDSLDSVGPAGEPATRALGQALEPEPAAAALRHDTEIPSEVLLSVVVDGPTWLSDEGWNGELGWRPDGGDVEWIAIGGGGARRGLARLPAPPRSREEFVEVTLADLPADVLQLKPAPEDSNRFELHVALMKGAILEWDDDVPGRDRVPLELALGGDESPLARAASGGRRVGDGLTGDVREVQLPFQLPRPAIAQTVWVGAPGFVWRGFTVPVDAGRIPVRLERGATLRVLHDGPIEGEERSVVIQGYPGGHIALLPIVDDAPLVFERRPAKTHSAELVDGTTWEGATTLARIPDFPLPAGETVEVDLRADSIRGQCATLRIDVTMADPDGEPPYVTLHRRLSGRRTNWILEDPPKVLETGAGGSIRYEALGLEDGHYRVVAHPFGTAAEIETARGETRYVSLDTRTTGAFVLQGDFDPADAELRVQTGELDAEGRTWVSRGTGTPPLDEPQPIAPGTYVVSLRVDESAPFPEYASEPFQVVAGATTGVRMRPTHPVRITIEARHATTDELLVLPHAAWLPVRVADAASGAVRPAHLSLHRDGLEIQRMEVWTSGLGGEVRVVPPSTDHYTFEPVAPFVPTDGLRITLRGTPR